MIRTGDTIENPITGERVTFLATSVDTDGDAVVIETVVQPHGFVAAAHVHPAQSERFAVQAGTLGLKVGRKRVTLAAGEIAIVEAGTAHRFWNAGDEPVRFMCEVRPALRFEQLLETMFALAADGKTNRKGIPNLLRLAVIARAYFDVVRLPFSAGGRPARGLGARRARRQAPGLPADLRSHRRAADREGIGSP
jgi:mannose-6-phosphate isomerase-like protein (cupin superfamily)